MVANADKSWTVISRTMLTSGYRHAKRDVDESPMPVATRPVPNRATPASFLDPLMPIEPDSVGQPRCYLAARICGNIISGGARFLHRHGKQYEEHRNTILRRDRGIRHSLLGHRSVSSLEFGQTLRQVLTSHQAQLALEFDLAIREYVGEAIRPEMAKRIGKDEFILPAMSTSYAAREIAEKVRAALPRLPPQVPLRQSSQSSEQGGH